MSDDSPFAPPPFRPADALGGLKRQLRDLKLAERGGAFEWRGQPVVRVEAGTDAIDARLAKRPAVSPEWQAQRLKNGADVRRFVETVKAQLARWGDDD